MTELTKLALVLALMFTGLSSQTAYAKGNPRDTTNVKINISGTIVANASCKISGGSPIAIEYGDVYINEISGDNYRKEIPYGVTCQGDPEGKSIQIQMVGDVASFDSGLLSTDASGLGIKVLQNGNQMDLNKWYNLDPSNKPKLEGVLVKQSGASFSNGQEFNAGVTLTVAYN